MPIDFVSNFSHDSFQRFPLGLLFVAPHTQEATGDKAIPQTFAAVCAEIFQGVVDTEIVQSDRVYCTDATPMELLAARAQFEGKSGSDSEVRSD